MIEKKYDIALNCETLEEKKKLWKSEKLAIQYMKIFKFNIKVAITSGCITALRWIIANIVISKITSTSETVLTGIPLNALVDVMYCPNPPNTSD